MNAVVVAVAVALLVFAAVLAVGLAWANATGKDIEGQHAAWERAQGWHADTTDGTP